MKKAFNLFALVLLAAMLTTTGCKKESTTATNLLEGSTEYTGDYPSATYVSYTHNGTTNEVLAYPGQFVTFFELSLSETDATQIITANGGSVLSKIPAIGYYFVQVDTLAAQAFYSSLAGNPAVVAIDPNTVAWPQNGAYILDFCSENHGQQVRDALQDCAGTMEVCTDMMVPEPFFGGTVKRTDKDKVIQGWIHSNSQWYLPNSPTLINLSFQGGLRKDYAAMTTQEQQLHKTGWKNYIKSILDAIKQTPQSYRDQLVITISSGNYATPIQEMMDDLRAMNPAYSDLLSNNILIVSTDSVLTNGLRANHAINDPDVVVLNNPAAQKGTSFAAPCALGYIQSVMQQKGVNATEALKAVKAASWMTPNREVKLGNVLNVTGAEQFACGTRTLVGNAVMGDCVFQFNYDFGSVTANWNGSSGSITMPTDLVVNLLSGVDCEDDGTLRELVMSGALTGNNSAITGILTGYITTTSGTAPINLKFTGQKSGDKITGTLQSHGVISFPETLQLTLTRL